MVEKNEAVKFVYDNIQFIKKEHGLSSDSDLCKATGIAKGTLSAVKSGECIASRSDVFRTFTSE